MKKSTRHFYVYRNCFTGAVSGGDMHTGGICEWIISNTNDKVYLIHPEDDGQDRVYDEVSKLRNLSYKKSRLELNTPMLMIMRTLYGMFKVQTPRADQESGVFIAGSHFLPDILPLLRHAKKSDLKAVYIHHLIQDTPRKRSIQNSLATLQEKVSLYFIKRHFDTIITVNKSVSGRLVEMGFTQVIYVSSNFVEESDQKHVPYLNKEYELVFFGRLMVQKGVYDFLELVKELQETDSFGRAAMIGAGPEESRIRNYIEAANLRIDLMGRVENDAKFNTVANSKLFLFPSIEEGWGIVIAESFSMGTPVLAYDLPVYKEVFEGKVSSVPINDLDELIKKCRALLNDFDAHRDEYGALQVELIDYAKKYRLYPIMKNEYEFLLGLSK